MNAFAVPPSDGVYTFANATCSADKTCTDSFFVISPFDGNGGDARVLADQYGAFIEENIPNTSGTSYIEVRVKDGGSFKLVNAVVGEYHPNSTPAATAFFDVYVAGYANDELVAQTPKRDSIGAYEEDYNLDFSSFQGKIIDAIRVYYSWSQGATTQLYFNLVNLEIQGASDTPPPPSLAAPTLTATSLNPTFTESDDPIVLFDTIAASTNDAGQHFTGMTVTVTNVTNGATEFLRVSSTYVALTDGNADTLPIGGAYSVAASGGTATVTVTGLSLDDENMAALIEWLAYINSSANPGGDSRTVTITSITDSGASNNTATLNLASTVSFGATPPSLTGMTVPADKTYKIGDNLVFTVTYTESVTVSGTPYIPLTIGSFQRAASYVSGSPGTTLTFSYTIADGDEDISGIDLGSAIELNGGTISSGELDAPLGLTGKKPSTAGVLVDGVAPTIASITRQSPATSSTNVASVTYRVTFSEAVSGVDAADFTATASSTAAGTVDSVSQASSSVYDVTVNNITGTGSLRLDLRASGTGITDAASNAISGGYTAGETYAIDRDPPLSISASVPEAKTYKAGDKLDFTVTFSENVIVTGTPYIEISLGSAASVAAQYDGLASTVSTLTFRHTVVEGNEDNDGVTVADAIALNGGSIKDAAGNSAATTSLGFASTAGVLVDGIAPTVTSIVRQSPSASVTNGSGVTYRVTFSEDVSGVNNSDFKFTQLSGNVTGSVYAAAPVGGSAAVYDVTVMYISGNGELRLDLKDDATIADLAGNSLVEVFTTGETYTIDATAPALPAANIVVDNRSNPHKVVLTFNKALDGDTIGAANAWSLTGLVSEPIYKIASVAFDGTSTVTLTLDPVDLTDPSTMITNADVARHLEVTPPQTLKDTAGNTYNAGTMTESGATHLLDTTAPALSAASITVATKTTGTLNLTASEAAWVYWIAVEAGSTEPNPAHVVVASDYVDVTVVASGNGEVAAGAGTLALTGLPQVGDYDIHVVATDAAGNLSTSIVSTTWTPPTAAPAVTTGAATAPGQAGATLNGSVDDEGLDTTVTFEYGTTNAYGTSVAAATGGTITEGTGSTAVSVTLSGLACNTEYHFRVVATNAAGTTYGNDETFTTNACPAPEPPPGTNPFNPGGTQTQTNLDPNAGIEPTRAPVGIVTNIGNLDNRVGISDNGIVVVLDNDLREPVRFADNPPDNVLIAMPSQQPVDVELGGETLNIQVDPETPNPPLQTILATTTLELPDGSTAHGLMLVQGEAAIGNAAPNAPIGGMELSQNDTLRDVYAESGPNGGIAGFTKSPDGSGAVSAESGEVQVRVRHKGNRSGQAQALTLTGIAAAAAYADTTDEIMLTLVTGEVARFDTRGELMGVFLGSLSGKIGKTGDEFVMHAPNGVAAYPATTLVFDGGNIPARLGMPFSDFLNEQLAGQLYFVQRSDGITEVTSANGGKFYARAVRGFEVVPDAVDGPSSNADGSLNLTYGGIRSTWQPMLEDAADLAQYFRAHGGFVTEVLENGNVQLTSGTTHFFVARPRHALRSELSGPQGLAPVAAGDAALFYTNARGQQQQLDPAFHDEAQLRLAAAAQGWTLTRHGVGGNNLSVTAPDGTVYEVVPDFRVDVLDSDPGLRGVIRQEGGRLYFYYADEPLKQGFTLK